MSLVTEKFVFFHLPKTGGQFVRHVLNCFGIHNFEVGEYHGSPRSIQNTQYSILPTIRCVRHPVSWYQSRWNHRIKNGWKPLHPLDWACASNDFNKFASNVLKYDDRGRYTSLVKLFEEGTEPFVLKTESLTHDLFRVLKFFGYNLSKTKLYEIQKINFGNQCSSLSRIDSEVFEQLVNKESYVINKYYDGILNPNDLDSRTYC